jgi:hypothetical protein
MSWLRITVEQWRFNRSRAARRRELQQCLKLTDKFIATYWKEPDPNTGTGWAKWPEVRRWQLGDVVLKHERYIRGDIITYTNIEELAAWVDQTHAYGVHGPGRGDFQLHPSFNLQLVQSLIARYEQT